MRLALVLAVLLVGCGSGAGTRERPDPNVIEGADVERRDLRRVEDMLRGQLAGVQVEERGGQLVIRIRGGAFGASNQEPLFVLDGIPLQSGPDGALLGITPYDVESIRVLKNVSETAAYGSRGANGVVLITTVRPPAPARDGG